MALPLGDDDDNSRWLSSACFFFRVVCSAFKLEVEIINDVVSSQMNIV